MLSHCSLVTRTTEPDSSTATYCVPAKQIEYKA